MMSPKVSNIPSSTKYAAADLGSTDNLEVSLKKEPIPHAKQLHPQH